MPEIELTLTVPIDERHEEMLDEIEDKFDSEDQSATDMLSRNLVDKEFSLKIQQMIYTALMQLELQEEQQEAAKMQARRAGVPVADPEPDEDA